MENAKRIVVSGPVVSHGGRLPEGCSDFVVELSAEDVDKMERLSDIVEEGDGNARALSDVPEPKLYDSFPCGYIDNVDVLSEKAYPFVAPCENAVAFDSLAGGACMVDAYRVHWSWRVRGSDVVVRTDSVFLQDLMDALDYT